MVKADMKPKESTLRPLKCELNYLTKSDGSAILSQGETVALVSVNGPLDIKMQSQSIEKSTIEVIYSSKGGKPSVSERYKEHLVKQTCEAAVLGSLYPRSGITITVQELEDYGGFLACSLNCVCLALLNSGIAMNYVFAAVSCCINEQGNIVVDPNPLEAQGCLANMTFVFDSRERGLVTGFTDGSFSEAAYKEAMEQCRAASDLLFVFYRDIVKKYSNVIG